MMLVVPSVGGWVNEVVDIYCCALGLYIEPPVINTRQHWL